MIYFRCIPTFQQHVNLRSKAQSISVMGLCKCPKKKVTNLFCFEHRVNVCENCLVANHQRVSFYLTLTVTVSPGRFAPNSVHPVSRFAPIPVRRGSYRPDSLSPWVVSPSFINTALKNEIWKIPLQIFVFWMLLHGYFIFVFLIINMLS